MSKKNVNPKIIQKPARDAHPGSGGVFDKPVWTRHLNWILIGALFVLLAMIYFPVAFQHKAPITGDITQWQGAAKSIIDYNAEHSDRALWTQNMFSGMPAYMISFPNRYPFLENLSRLTDKVINWRIFLLFIGGLGIFLLLRFWKMSPWICFAGALAFIFSCHWVGLLDIGHNTKFRAIMYVPWVMWALMYLRKKPGLLGLGFLATTLIVQLRENHPQISYYLYLFVGMYWLWQLIESIRDKQIKQFALFTALTAAAFGLTLLAVMNPYLSTMEYSHYTMRGGASGLDTAYAQGWSFHPLEIFGLIIPDFFGGINQNYWGFMPFTQIYNYFGIVVLAFGVLALFGKKHRRTAIFLWISSVLFTMMSFGSFSPMLSDLLLNYLPYFNKFRVPSMILTMVQINAVLLAALGWDTLQSKVEEQDAKFSRGLFKAFWITGAIFIAWVLLAKTVFKGLPFTNSGELAQLESRNLMARLPEIKSLRLDAFYKSGILSLLFLALSMGISYLHSLRKLRHTGFMVLISVLVFVDLWIYTGKHLKEVRPAQQHQERFTKLDVDEFLLSDKSNHRIYPFNTNEVRTPGEWPYYHQTVQGYSAAKLKRYDDLIKVMDGDNATQRDGEWIRYLKGAYQNASPTEIPTPVLDMLSVKYIVMPDSLPYTEVLQKIDLDFISYTGLHVYRNTTAMPRAWFVDAVQQVPADSALAMIAKPSFDPRRIALVEEKIDGIAKPDSAKVTQTAAKMHELSYNVSTDKDAFLVLSEIYYPAGWKATLDGKEIPIHAANYVLRGLKIPAGNHELKLVFAPDSYRRGVTLSLVGLLLSLVILAGGIAMRYRSKREPIS